MNASIVLPTGLENAMRLVEKEGPVQALHVFDFDNTLVRTPDMEQGVAAYRAATGQEWPFKGWWGREESLQPPVVPQPLPKSFVIRSVFDELEDITMRAQTAAAVVVTGRLGKLRSSVLRVLHEAARAHTGEEESFLSDEVLFNHPGGGLSTLNYKMGLIEALVREGPAQLKSAKEIHIWEDRKEHAREFATDFATRMFRQYQIDTVVHFVAPKTP